MYEKTNFYILSLNGDNMMKFALMYVRSMLRQLNLNFQKFTPE